MARVLTLFAHPRQDRSEINWPMFEAAQTVEGVTCVDLYARYPSFEINIAREQSSLLDHDVIILQHPLYWYSAPAIIKEWMDLVLEYDFAYGAEGTALNGKVMFNAVSCGTARSAYTVKGGHIAELRTLLMPFERTADLCNMRYLAPYATFSAGSLRAENRVKETVSQWHSFLTALTQDRIDLDAAANALTLTDHPDSFLIGENA